MQNQAAPNQRPIIPRVRYHPSIQIAGSRASAQSVPSSAAGTARQPQSRTPPNMVQKNQDSRRTGPGLRPQVVPGAPDKDPGPAGDRSSRKPTQRSRTGAAHRPQTRTQPKTAPDNRHSTGLRPDGEPEPKRDSGPAKAPPTPEQVPSDLRADSDRGSSEQVEVSTRGQSTNQAWFDWRKNRITASVAHRIAHSRFVNGRSKAPPLSYSAAVTGEGPKVQTRAMSWGIEKEAEVVRRYQKSKTAASGRAVSVSDCGSFIDGRRPWSAASPDGIVVDGETGRRSLCSEVKCPYKHRNRSVEDACRDDPAFCLQSSDEDGRRPGEPPVYASKTSHCYFTQIQVQSAVTGSDRADSVVYTSRETAVVPVEFDPVSWTETASKSETFYRDAVLPHLRQKRQQDAAARPES